MSRNKKAAAPNQPSVSNPGADLPAEVTAPEQAQGAREKQRAREEAEMFSMFRRELGGSGFVTLQRSHPNSGQHKPANIGTMASDDFTIERVMEIYGGGDFIARGRTAGGTFTEERRFSIDHSIPPKNPKTPQGDKAAAPALDVAAIVREMSEAGRREAGIVVDLAKTILTRPQEGSGQMLEMFKFLAEQQAKSAEQFREMIQKSEDRTARILEKLAARDAAPAAEPAKPLLEQLEELKEVAAVLGLGKGGDDSGDWKKELIGMAREALPIVAARLQIAGAGPGGFPPQQVMQPAQLRPAPALVSTGAPGAAQPLAPAGSAAAGAPGSQPAALEITAANPDPDSDMMITIALNRFRVSAIAAAKKGKDPYDFICSTLQFVPEEWHAKIFEAAHSPDWFANIFAANPEATQHLKFLTELREAMFARALVAHAIKFAEVNKAPPETAMQFAGWLPEDARNALWQWCDSEEWAELFGGAPIDPAWLESLRVGLDKILGGEQEPEPAAAPLAQPAPAAKQTGKKVAVRKTA